MNRGLVAFAALLSLLARPVEARAEASEQAVRQRLEHAKAAGLLRGLDRLGELSLERGDERCADLGIPRIITVWSKTNGTPIEVRGATGFNVSPLMLLAA